MDLTRPRAVGVGSVCRRHDTADAERLMRELALRGIRAHGFGFKADGLARAAKHMTSADSMAWSYAARFGPIRLPGCKHETCEYCPTWALRWRRGVWRKVGALI